MNPSTDCDLLRRFGRHGNLRVFSQVFPFTDIVFTLRRRSLDEHEANSTCHFVYYD